MTEEDKSVLRVCGNEIQQIAESIAGIRGLLENPDDPLLINYLSVIHPALDSLESGLLSISKTLLNRLNQE